MRSAGPKQRTTVVAKASSELLNQTRVVVSSQLSRTGAVEHESSRENTHCWKLLPSSEHK
jgi:hypothetical protein